MPRNFKNASRAHRDRVNQYKLELIDKQMQLDALRPKAPRKNSKMAELCELLYTEYEDLFANPQRGWKSLPASQFDWIKDQYSPVTINKAKRLLGIRSFKTGVGWRWSIPRYSYDQTLDRMHQNRLAAIEREVGDLDKATSRSTRPAASQLQIIMSNHSYLMPANDAKREMMESGYARGTINRMKTELGIGSMKGKDGLWYWIWGHEEVIEWVDQQLSGGPVGMVQLYNLAWKERGWAPEVLQAAQSVMGYVKLHMVFDKKDMTRYMGWVDINHPSEGDDEINPRDYKLVSFKIEDQGWYGRNGETEG